MIKFFRSFRQRLLSENKIRKYIFYAVGEIVLVMIGILLAIQVSNWNEKRKASETIEELLTVFEEELKSNIIASSSLIRRGYLTDSITTQYINNKISREALLKNRRLYLNFGTSTREFKDDNLNKLIDLEKELPKVYTDLIAPLKELKRRIASQHRWEEKVIAISMQRKKELSDELPWLYLNDSLSNEKRIQHYLTDPFYKSKVLHYNDYNLGENTWDASLIRTSSVALLWTIKGLREANALPIDSFLKNLDLTPFEVLECGGYPFKKKERVNFRQSFIFYNNTNDIVHYNLVRTNGEKWNSELISILPNSFKLNEIFLPTNTMVEVIENDSCKKIYRRTKEDYLVIN